jgi:hypothetical protein
MAGKGQGSNPLSSSTKTRGSSAPGNPARPPPQPTPVRQASRPAPGATRRAERQPDQRGSERRSPRSGHAPEPSSVRSQRPLSSTLGAEGGLPWSRRLGRSRVRHRRGPDRAARATLAVLGPLLARGQARPARTQASGLRSRTPLALQSSATGGRIGRRDRARANGGQRPRGRVARLVKELVSLLGEAAGQPVAVNVADAAVPPWRPLAGRCPFFPGRGSQQSRSAPRTRP